ncbi:MAG TPA: hypothetical protein VMW29_01810 [Candidatus Bathyarchaeia archaeon]|nr:hypothetical protein [Candidatus Bathyarchaeia archaeon]
MSPDDELDAYMAGLSEARAVFLGAVDAILSGSGPISDEVTFDLVAHRIQQEGLVCGVREGDVIEGIRALGKHYARSRQLGGATSSVNNL